MPRTASPELERPTLHAYRGVATALARTTGTDVLLWRVLFVVLAFFDGLGIALYLVGLVTIRREGESQSMAERLFRGPNRRLHGKDVLLIALLVIAVGSLLDHGDSVVAVAVAVGIAVLFFHGRQDGRTGEVMSSPALVLPAVPAPLEPLSELPVIRIEAAPKQRSVLGALTLGLALLVSSFLVLLNTADATDVHPEAILAVALGIVGAGIVASAWWGRSWLLYPVAIMLGLALAATSVARPAIEAGVGDRTWNPTGPATYRLGVGEATLDLRDVTVRESGTTAITAQVDVGHLIVIVPDGLRVALHAEAEIGELMLLGNDSHGRGVSRDENLGPEGRPQVRLDLKVRAGQVEVRHG